MSICRTDDPLRDFSRQQAIYEKWMQKLPECYECGEKIQDEDCFEYNGELICTACLMANHKKKVEDYIE